MSKVLKRWIGAALVLVLILCILPVSVFAAEEEPLEITSMKIVFTNGETIEMRGVYDTADPAPRYCYSVLDAMPLGDYEFYFMINDDPSLTFGGTTAADGGRSKAVAGETVKFTVPQYDAPYDCVDMEINFFGGEMSFSVEYEKKIDISKGTAEYIGDRYYNGEHQCAEESEIRVIVNGEQLQYVSDQERDYLIRMASWSITGEGNCTIFGEGEYSGSIRNIPFTIKKRPLTITLADQTIYYGESIRQDAYTVEGLADGDSITVDKLTASTSSVTDNGEIKLAYGNFSIRNEADTHSSSRTGYYTFTIIPGKLTILPLSIEGAEVSLDGSEFTYDGSEKKPVATVTLEGAQLVEGTDYQVTYSDNVDAGTATVTIEGIGNYGGMVQKSFTILPKEITAEISVKDRDYDGTKDAQIESAALVGAVTGDDVTLTQGTASFSDAEGEDLAVTFTGFSLSGADAGNYTLVMPTNVTGTINPKPVETTEETTTPTTQPEETTEETTEPTTEETTAATTQPVVTVPPTDGSPVTGDTGLMLPALGVLISVMGLVVMIYLRKKQMLA